MLKIDDAKSLCTVEWVDGRIKDVSFFVGVSTGQGVTFTWGGGTAENLTVLQLSEQVNVNAGLTPWSQNITIKDTALDNHGTFKQGQNIRFESSQPGFTNVFNFGTYELAGGSLTRPSRPTPTSFQNYGTFKKTAAGLSTVWLEFSNHLGGTVSVEKGASLLRFASGGTHAGTFSVPATSIISFDRGFFLPTERAVNKLKPTCLLLGDGLYGLGSASQLHVEAGANLTINRLNIDDTPQVFPGDVTGIKLDGQVTVRSMTMLGGKIWGASQLTIPIGGTLHITDGLNTTLEKATLLAFGTVNWDASGDFKMADKAKFIIDGGLCLVAATGSLRSDNPKGAPGQTPEIILRRNGLLTNVPPIPKPLIFEVPVRNLGGREVWTNIITQLSPYGEQTDGQTVLDSATVSLDGTFTESGGTVALINATFDLTEQALVSGGTFDLDNSTVAADAGMAVESGGTLSGSGSIDAPFSITGTLVTTVGPVLGQCDEIHVTHFAALGGTLSIDRGSYVPGLSETFTILTFSGGYSGTFASVVCTPFLVSGTAYQLVPKYNATNVTLIVAPVMLSAPTVTALSPDSGSTAGGETVIITGTNFGTGSGLNFLSAVYNVSFGGAPVLQYTVDSATQITATTPPHAAATVDVSVRTSAGLSSNTANDDFEYIADDPPEITSLSETTGYTTGGTSLTITGTDFTGATGVTFGSDPAVYFHVVSDTAIDVIAPPGDAGTVDVRVTTNGGTSPIVLADEFTYTEQPAPTVTALSPTSGGTSGGTSVTITGTHFENVSNVTFDGIPASFTVPSATSITAFAPPHTAGTVDVIVSTIAGSSASGTASRFTYTAVGAPTVAALSPSSGSTAGGTPVVITGTFFTGASSVLFDGMPAANFAVQSSTQITALTPAHSAGTVHVTVKTPSGTSAQTSADQFTYTAATAPAVTAVSPSSGSTAGNYTITVTGSNFTGATSVRFGAVDALSFTVLSDGTITAVAPPQAAATVHVTVTTRSGTSSTSSADQFTYTAATAPAVTGLSPDSGPATGGTAVTILGTNFTGASSVVFGTASAYFSVLSDTTILASAPSGAAGTVDVRVTTPSGTSSLVTADEYDYTSVSLPTLTALSITSGSTAGGDLLVITGTDLADAYEVRFGDVSVSSFVVNSSTQLTVTTPPHTAGTIDVVVFTRAGATMPSSASRFEFTLASGPTITGISPSSGSTAGGTQVVITGTGFTSALRVTFGTEGASFLINSATQITATSPAQAAGTVDVRVYTSSGSSAPTSADQFTYTAATAPAVTSLSVTTGPTSGDTVVAIFGSNFTGATTVLFGSVPATYFEVSSPTCVKAWSPPQPAGTVHITVSTFAGTSSTSSADEFTYTAVTAPAVSAVTPNSGTTAGGNPVLITGSGFTAATDVTFGALSATWFSVVSNTAIRAFPPPQAAGAVDVRVTTASGTSSVVTADQYTYTSITTSAPAVTGVSPATGSTAGGQIVTVTGTDFFGATSVTFGGVSATSFSIDSKTQITAVAPAGSAGAVDVRVTTNNGTSAIVTADQFTFLSAGAPTVSSLGTTSGSTAGGTSVVLTGTNFTAASAVLFGGVPAASFTVDSSTQITAVTPPAYPGSVAVSVTTSSGTGTSGANAFTFTAASGPVVTGLSPTSGSTAGGTSVVITGTGFTGASAVIFGDFPVAIFTVDSATQITAITPPSSAGVVDVIVCTTAAKSDPSSAARYTFTAAPAPAVNTLGTTSGSSAGGTTVVITGTNLAGASQVLFGGVDAEFTIDSSTQITATAPPQTAGTVLLTVLTPTGNSAFSTSAHFTYTAASAPTVTALGSSGGSTAGGDTLTITGTNFTAATTVTFGDLPADFTVDSATQITAVSPPQAAGTVSVRVTTTAGTSATSSASDYTYTAASAPSVSGLTPASGSAAGGDTVVILGAHFTGASAVSFGSWPAWYFEVLSDSAIAAVAPAGTAGTVDVRVTTPSGTSSVVSADEFTYDAVTAPTITSLDTTSGSTAGGTTVTLTGTGLLQTTEVTIGGVGVPFLVLSATSLQLTTAPMPAGTFDLVVQVPGAASAPAQLQFVAASAPAITSLGTTTGSTAGGTPVTITGTDFTGAAQVLFGDRPASFTVVSSTSIVASAPAASASGAVNVVVLTPTGTSAVTSSTVFTYTAASAPTLTGLSLTTGSTTGGLVINLTGTNFTAATAVSFGTAAAAFTVQSPTWITATLPPRASGTVSVTVTTAGGTSGGQSFTYSAPSAPTLTGLTPATGGTAGGNSVTITGTGFMAATAVSFDTTASPSFWVLSDTVIFAVVPAGAAGAADVTVTTAAGTSSVVTAGTYTYTSPSAPTLTGLGTTSGPNAGGFVVVITGTNFTNVWGVQFGAYPASSFVVNSATQITAVAPAQPAGTVDVTVETAGGTTATSTASQLTYTAASSPTVTAVSPAAGPLAGGNTVLISGTNLLGTTGVQFGTAAAVSFQVLSDTAVSALAPAGSAGTVDVRVTTLSGTSSAVTADHYAYQAAPAITLLSSGLGPVAGGISITITGTDLTGATAVYFGDTAASFTVNSSTSITVSLPAHAAGSVLLSVVTPGGQSGPLTFTYTTGTSSISGLAWVDTDADGIRDTGESGLAGVVVNLYDAYSNLIASTITDAYGHYSFHYVYCASGGTMYTVQFVITPSYSGWFTGQDQGSDDTIDSDVNAEGSTGILTFYLDADEEHLDAGVFSL